MAVTDSKSECAKNQQLNGWANEPQWISKKKINKQNKKKLSTMDVGLA